MSRSEKLRIAVLVEQGSAPPDDPGDVDLESVEWAVEYDVVSTLRRSGHDVVVVEVEQDLIVLHRFIDNWKPHIAFNLLEGFDGISLFDQNVVSYLELLKVPYTGCNPRGLMVARNKALSKKVLSYHAIATPAFQTFARGREIRRAPELAFPLFVKSLTEEASAGISEASLVRDEARFVERVRYIHEKIGTDALVESYIEGRELYVGVLGNTRLQALPVWELDFGNAAGPHIATEKLKFDPEHRKRRRIDSGPARPVAGDLTTKLQAIARQACRVLGMNGYARVDFRLGGDGKPYVLEVNANPYLAHFEDFAKSAERAGIGYPQLLEKIIALGMRWEPELALAV